MSVSETTLVDRIFKYSDLIVAFGIILIVLMMIIPLPHWLKSLNCF